jgi:hypothetical protein
MAKEALRILDERTNADYAVQVNKGAIRAMRGGAPGELRECGERSALTTSSLIAFS